jgi:hypothetical protein
MSLGYERGASGAWVIGKLTDTAASAARRLATLRAERECWESTGQVPLHERLVPGGANQPALVPEVRPAVPAADRTAAEPADAVAKARKREQTRLRVRRYRARNVTHPHQPHQSTGGVTSPAPQPRGAATVANLGQFSTLSGGSGRVHR